MMVANGTVVVAKPGINSKEQGGAGCGLSSDVG